MTQSFETKAAFRFGYGFHPNQPPVSDIETLLAQLKEPDFGLAQYSGPDYPTRVQTIKTYIKNKRRVKLGEDAAKSDAKQSGRQLSGLLAHDVVNTFSRSIFSPQSFRERLIYFWTDHFTVVPKTRFARTIWGNFQETAIRPHISGSFADLLIAATTHPSMVIFLNQAGSTGPNSKAAKSKKKKKFRGLNENLAREILELHTLGVLGGYTQTDVRQLAELLTGLAHNKNGTAFQKGKSEPGSKTVLGKTYGGDVNGFDEIKAFLRDVAIHPNTAEHIARKLVVHFISDDPDPDLIAQMTQEYLNTNGDLYRVYSVMLNHSQAWTPIGAKAKQPYDFLVSSLRALALTPDYMDSMKVRKRRSFFSNPVSRMGQPIKNTPGPNGWPEEVEAWITPQGVAARLNWALSITQDLGADTDPRMFVESTLKELAGDTLKFAVGGAEQRNEGLALVLVSPEFNRR